MRRRLASRPYLQKIVANTGWLTLERVFRLGVGLVVSILVARHLGPEQFGILSYAASVISFLGTFVYLGLSGLVVRDLVRFPEDTSLLLGTTFFMKLAGSLLALCLVFGVAWFAHGLHDQEFWVLAIIGLSLLARPFETIDFWFQSRVQSKYAVAARSGAFLAGSASKIALVFLGASVVGFACVTSLELTLGAVLLVCIYKYTGGSIARWKASLGKAKELLAQSWIIILSGFLALANLKVDQIMLRWLSGTSEVGVYSVAVTFSEVWYFIPEFIVVSVYPRLIELKKSNSPEYDRKFQQIFDILFLIAFVVAIAMTVLAGPLIPFLYGDKYAAASSVLIIHVWAGIFMFMRSLFSKWVLIENALVFSLVSHGFGALVNVLANLALIPVFGGQGAAVATLLSYAASSYFFLFFFAKTRPLALKMSKSLLLPVRVILARGKIWA